MLFLILFVNNLGRLSFREGELRSLLEMQGVHDVDLKWGREGDVDGQESVFMEIDLPSEDVARAVAARSVCMKGVFEAWGVGKTPEDCWQQVESLESEKKDPYLREGSTFKINILSYGSQVGGQVENQRIVEECFQHVPFKGKVLMDKTRKGVRHSKGPRAENQFWYMEDVGTETAHQTSGRDTRPKTVYFAREIALGQRSLLEEYDLKKREYLCSTSMTAENSFLVANFACVDKGKLVLDPFCGSASLLISAAHFGAVTMGSDIDIRVIRGKEKDKAMPGHCRFARKVQDVEIGPLHNFKQYGLPPPLDLVRSDNAQPVWRWNNLFDAIVCDPPYGVRAGARKTGTFREPKTIPDELREGHIPGTIAYAIGDVLSDLLNMAAKYLVVGGRLVFWLPTTYEYSEDDLPQHPCMLMKYNCEEVVTLRWQRRLITMVKIRDAVDGEHATCKMKEAGLEAGHDNFSMKYFNDENRRDHREKKSKKDGKNRAAKGDAEVEAGKGSASAGGVGWVYGTPGSKKEASSAPLAEPLTQQR